MSIKTGYSSPYSRMRTLANEVCSVQLRENNLKPICDQFHPEQKAPDYSTLFQFVSDRLQKAMKEAFSNDPCLKVMESKLMSNDTIDDCATSYSTDIKTIERIQKSLTRIGYPPPSSDLSQNQWCKLS